MATRERTPTQNPPRSAHEEAALALIADLEGSLKIDQHALDEALIQQPDLFYRVSKELTLAVSRRDLAKQELEELIAELGNDVRVTAVRNEEKVTEGGIKEKVTMDNSVKRAEREMLSHSRIVGQLTALKDAYVQRSYMLKDLAGLYVANYYTDSAGSGRDPNAVKNRAGEDARAAMSDERKRRRERQ